MNYKIQRMKYAIKMNNIYFTYGYWKRYKIDFLDFIYSLPITLWSFIKVTFGLVIFIPYVITRYIVAVTVAPFDEKFDMFDSIYKK